MDRLSQMMLMGAAERQVAPPTPSNTDTIVTAFGDPATINRNTTGTPSLSNVGSVSTVSTVPPGTGRSFSASFSGSNYLEATLGSGITPSATFTVSFLSRLDTSTDSFQRIFSISRPGGGGEISVENYNNITANAVTINSGAGQVTNVSVGNIRDWFRVTLIRQSGELKVYIGTNLINTLADSTDYSDRTLFRLGGRGDDSDLRAWTGLVHSFEYYYDQAVIPT